MTFVLKAGAINRPLPAFKGDRGERYEYDCGWCDAQFMTARSLVAHVTERRQHGSHQPR